MKRIIIILFFITTNICIGQKISTIDFDKIKSAVTDSFSVYYYPLLMERMYNHDSTLTLEEYKYIYYGNIYSENYNPYGQSDLEKEFMQKLRAKKFSSAAETGLKVLKENPVNLDVLFKMYICYYEMKEETIAIHYARQYSALLNVIHNSGDGKSIPTAFVVIKVNDEYQLLATRGLTMVKQSLLNGPTDKLTINTKGQKKQKGVKKIKELYFNVSVPFNYLSKQFKEKE